MLILKVDKPFPFGANKNPHPILLRHLNNPYTPSQKDKVEIKDNDIKFMFKCKNFIPTLRLKLKSLNS